MWPGISLLQTNRSSGRVAPVKMDLSGGRFSDRAGGRDFPERTPTKAIFGGKRGKGFFRMKVHSGDFLKRDFANGRIPDK